MELEDIRLAHQRLRGVAVHTPLVLCPHSGTERLLYFKPESFQPVGSFKLRGAYNKIASLSEEEKGCGVIAYSSGNHAQGVAYAACKLGVQATIVMPGSASKVKLERTAELGAEIVRVGAGSEERRAKAEEIADQRGCALVPPYNDEALIAGQGTVGLEILEDLPDVETVLVPVGGGGLISGVAAALKLARPEEVREGDRRHAPRDRKDADQKYGLYMRITASWLVLIGVIGDSGCGVFCPAACWSGRVGEWWRDSGRGVPDLRGVWGSIWVWCPRLYIGS